MKFKIFIIIWLILILIPGVLAVYSNFNIRAFKIGDNKDIDLVGNLLGNGSVKDLTCISGCSGFYSGSSFNSTYDNTTNQVNGNLINWNNTYNATYHNGSIRSNATFVTIPNSTFFYYSNNGTLMYKMFNGSLKKVNLT